MTKKINPADKTVIGKEEWCALPELGLPAIKARIDSGAKTSALHAFNISLFEEDGQRYAHFDIHPLQDDNRTIKSCRGLIIDRRAIKSSSGVAEHRYVIRTPITLGKETWDIEITLTNRDAMGFRMLIGREALGDHVLIDPNRSALLGKKTTKDAQSLYKTAQKKPKKDKLDMVVLATNPNLYSNKRLMEAGEERGYNMRFVNISQCYMNMSASKPQIFYRGGQLLNNVDVVIPRIRPSMTFYGCAVARQFETIGAFCLNDSISIARSRDKLRSLQMLANRAIRMPTTGFANSPMDTNDIIKMVGGAPLVIKLLEGTQGKGVVLAETAKAAESVINAFKSLKANILVQEFIKEADGKDLRCFVIDGQVVGTIQREAAPGEFRANLHLGGSARAIKPTKDEEKTAINAAQAMGLHVAGVDILRSKSGPMVLEINSAPGLEGIEGATGTDVAGMMIESAYTHIKQGDKNRAALELPPTLPPV
ncbi:MAG: 30S ribosomal protein S6--L-glutamate ligase [Alphaproteobacteria bacterium GM202ARS2]|nr:30S ribosomal protein S6--L-glutamate ligase [Alphaproteobacteria bacterium GM202ARS2]